MRKYLYFFIAALCLASVAGAAESQIWGDMRIANILGYGQEGTSGLGPLFTMLHNNEYFEKIYLGVLVGVPAVFVLHYLAIGPKVFAHDRKKIYAFGLFVRTVHQIAAVSFILVIPTGFIITFGAFFGGGSFVSLAKDVHDYATIPFAIVIIPMFLVWLKDMLPSFDDVKWMMIAGGYLSKAKKPVPAGKFNAGQKMWFLVATIGGMAMIITGAAMYFLDFDIEMLRTMTGLSQIDILRGSAILHNAIGIVVAAFFFTHIYMSVFAIKGAIWAIITGYKEEEEVEILHSTWYKKLKKEGKV